MEEKKDFKHVDVQGSKVPLWLKLIGWFILWLVIAIILSSFFNLFRSVGTFGGIEMFLSLIVVGYIYYKFRYKKSSRIDKEIENGLLYFIKSNGLYTTRTEDVEGTKVEKIEDYADIAYLITDKKLVIRYMIDGSKYDGKADDFEKSLGGLFGLRLLNKKVKTTHVDYEFALVDEERLVVDNESKDLADRVIEEYYNETELEATNKLGSIDLNSAIEWDYSKLPHALIAGATGGGKTFFINYLIMEFLKDEAKLYACDPKQSDLYALKRVMPKGRIGSTPGQIAGIMRKANEEMESRYARYIEGEEYKYGYDYLDHGLKPVVVFFDEIGAFKAIASKDEVEEVYSYMTSIILKGRQMGVFMVLSTQQPNAENIPTQIRDQVGMRVSLGNMSTEGYRMIFGGSFDLKSVDGKGTGYLLIDGLGWETPRNFEAPYIDKHNVDVMEQIEILQRNIPNEEETEKEVTNE